MSPQLEEALPKYLQIANFIRDQIIRGDYKPGQAVPSERQIVTDWGVSRPTATRAVAALRADGLVASRQGFGSVVTSAQVRRGAHQRQVVVRRSGRITSPSSRADVVQSELVPAPDDVLASFGLNGGAMALCRQRVSFDGDAPRSMSVTWLHPSLAQLEPRLLTRENLPDEVVTYVEHATGRAVQLYRERVFARLATPDEARTLGLTEPDAVLVAYHTIFDVDGDIMSYELSIYPPERVRYEDEVLIDRGSDR